MRHQRRKKVFFWPKKGLVLIVFCFFFFAFAGFLKGYQEFQENNLSFPKTSPYLEKIEEGDLPKKIAIPKLKIDLAVLEGKVLNDKWEISEKGVSYLIGSGIPGRSGNVVIYGHNKKNQFGPIRWLKKDEEIKLINRKNEEFIYKVVETKTVSPQEVEILSPTQDSTLTLYTCTGFLDRLRFVIVAKLISPTPGVD